MAIDGTRPERVWCTGTEHCTIVAAYPSHRAVNVVDQKVQEKTRLRMIHSVHSAEKRQGRSHKPCSVRLASAFRR